MLQAILFDLDGTLLPMDNDYFTKYYFKFLARDAYGWGYTDTDALIKAVWTGVEAMVKNDGTRSNFDAFWDVFSAILGRDGRQDVDRFAEFYRTNFHNARAATQEAPLAAEAVRLAREKAGKVILATNPIFPEEADESRLSWIGLKMEDFDLVTDMGNCGYCKPNPDYYRDILARFGLEPEHCLMVGNNVVEDWQAASAAGIPCFMLTDNVINPNNEVITCPHGSYADMVEYLRSL